MITHQSPSGEYVRILEYPGIVHIVLDVLKSHQPSLPEFTALIGEFDGVQRVDVTVEEIDEKTVSLRVVIDGDFDYEGVKAHLARYGAEVQSVDRVVVGNSKY